EDRAAGEGAGRVDGHDRHRLALLPQALYQHRHQGGLAATGRPRDADDVCAALGRRGGPTHLESRFGTVFQCADGLCDRAPVAGQRFLYGRLVHSAHTTVKGLPKPSSWRKVPQISPCVAPTSAAATTCSKTLDLGVLADLASAA